MRTQIRNTLVVVVLCSILLVLGSWKTRSNLNVFEKVESDEVVELGAPTVGQGTVETRTVPNDALEYRNQAYGFSILYPKYLNIKEYPGADDTMTLVFQNVEKRTGFQIFILPYTKSTVDKERFRKDVSSGVQKNVREVTLAGASGAEFYSLDISLGETYEVWVIHNGRLYEITSLAPLDQWLQSILSTWQFI